MKWIPLAFTLMLALANCGYSQSDKKKQQEMEDKQKNPVYSTTDTSKVEVKDTEWQKLLTPEQYHIARQKGTERPWSSKFEKFNEIGTYRCVACGNALFRSDTKFDSGCGWPAFTAPARGSAVEEHRDLSHGMVRTEVTCANCAGVSSPRHSRRL